MRHGASKHGPRENQEDRIIKTTLCGVACDVSEGKGKGWKSNLSDALSSTSTENPLDLVGHILEFYVETLAPKL